MRLVWAVQALVDSCKQVADGTCSLYESYDRSQMLQGYYEAWNLTGLSVREDAAGKIALEVEDLGEPELKNIAQRHRVFVTGTVDLSQAVGGGQHSGDPRNGEDSLL